MKRRFIKGKLRELMTELDRWIGFYAGAPKNSFWYIDGEVSIIKTGLEKYRRNLFWIEKTIKRCENNEIVVDNSFDVDEIKARVDVSRLLGIKPDQRGTGKEFYKCPLHNEKTASFVWNTEEKYYCCFGCQEKGDIINLYQKLYKCDFVTACRELQYI
jgi:hypothetical protein